MSFSSEQYLDEFDPDANYYDSHISENLIFSSYHDIEEFTSSNLALLNDSNFISIFNQNIRSFNMNLDNFMLLFNQNTMPDCFVFF